MCMIVYCCSVIRISTEPVFSVSIDLARPVSIVWPCETAIVGDNGEKGLRIGPKVGRGWRGEAGGSASYKFFIPKDGKYHIWIYCLWFDECANAIFAQIDDLEKAILGNDPIYNKWHWARGFDVSLKKGTHSLVLSNHSDHVAMQKVIFASSASHGPDGEGLVFSDIFYDGFDGCDKGNFASWKIISGIWYVQSPDSRTCLLENALIGRSEDESLIMYQNDNWSSYSLDLAVKTIPSYSTESAIGICFGLKDPENYHQLRITPAVAGDKAKMMILRKKTKEINNLASFDLAWNQNFWHQVQIRLNQNSIEVKIDDEDLLRIPVNYQIKGGIGLSLLGKTTTYFDDIHIREIKKTKQ